MLAASAVVAQPAPAAEKPRAAAGSLLGPSESAAHVVVGTVGAVRRLDAQGFSAEFAVVRAIFGNARPGSKLRIAWEELSPSRAVRFANGERVLVALERLPNGSLWSTRFPKRNAVAVAGRGEAFAREFTAEGLESLGRYLALSRDQRESAAGVTALVAIVSSATQGDPLAEEAIVRLGMVAELGAKLDADAVSALRVVITDPGRHAALRAATVELAQERKLATLAPALREVAGAGGPLAPRAVEALGALGSLAPAEARAYALASDPALRAAALRGAPHAHGVGRLAEIVRSDGPGIVRAAALEALVAREGVRAVGDAADALFDADTEVQAAALRMLPAYPRESAQLLRARSFGPRASDFAATKPVLAGLSLLGADGVAVLREIERDHPNEEIRRLAQFLLGRTPEH